MFAQTEEIHIVFSFKNKSNFVSIMILNYINGSILRSIIKSMKLYLLEVFKVLGDAQSKIKMSYSRKRPATLPASDKVPV